MNEIMNISKVLNYDKFKCIADKCKFTCCEGWDISIDIDTYNKWKKENTESNYILNNIKIKKIGNEKKYYINKKTHEKCKFLDKQGLCNIVKSHGEEYLSLTCHTFPRIENVFENKKEFLLSCACPEVVEIISNISGKINMVSENEYYLKSEKSEFKIRESIINIMQQEGFQIEDKLIISFQMLSTILNCKNSRKTAVLEELRKHNSRDYIEELVDSYKELELNLEHSIEEINNLFLDITENYKKISILKALLEDIFNYAENIDIEDISDKWNDYKVLFMKHNEFIENCIVSKILSNCISSDVEEIAVSLQMIILEYLLVRYSLFLKYCISENKEIDIKDIKDYIVAFSRIIGNNTEAVIEFFRDGFGEEVLEIGYVCFIALF